MEMKNRCMQTQIHQQKYQKIKQTQCNCKDNAKSLNECGYHYGSSKLEFHDRESSRNNERIQNISDGKLSFNTLPTISATYCKTDKKIDSSQVKWSRNNIAITMERFQPIESPSNHQPLECPSYGNPVDYSYAYYEPGAVMCHSIVSTTKQSPQSSPKSIRALLAKSKEKHDKSQPNNRHSYTTHYGTHENIYEDISNVKPLGLVSSTKSLSAPDSSKAEFQQILHNHYRVLEELNLSVEELLLSSTKTNVSSSGRKPKRTSKTRTPSRRKLNVKNDLQSSMNELFIGEDSGFSGSSSGASYIGSLRNYKTAVARALRSSSEAGSNERNEFLNEPRKGSFYTRSQFEGKSPDSTAKIFKLPIWNKR